MYLAAIPTRKLISEKEIRVLGHRTLKIRENDCMQLAGIEHFSCGKSSSPNWY